MSLYCCPRSTKCIPRAQLLSFAAIPTIHFPSVCFLHCPNMYFACSLTLPEGQTAITYKLQKNKFCISSVTANAAPAVASQWFFCPFSLAFIALMVLPEKVYGEVESPVFCKIKITAQLHSLNGYPRRKSLWRPVHWTARACVCLFICDEFVS